ncbi:MAG TPA: NAD(P)H-dependent oxidoreductase subunit E [Sediminispirochaeta sp.]|nr:NAD(P)H-dependent oxidoreductase subunit E [Sediminispirochaeta sp.]
MGEDLQRSEKIIEKYRAENGTLIGILQDLNEEYGYLPEEVLKHVARELEVPESTLYSLATFYTSFRLQPIGKYHIRVCVGTACHVKGAPFIVDKVERELGLKPGETSSDGLFTFETVNCLGACALAPLVTSGDDFHGKMDQKKVMKVIDKYRNKKKA